MVAAAATSLECLRYLHTQDCPCQPDNEEEITDSAVTSVNVAHIAYVHEAMWGAAGILRDVKAVRAS